MKKFILIFLSLILVFSLFACGKNNDRNDEDLQNSSNTSVNESFELINNEGATSESDEAIESDDGTLGDLNLDLEEMTLDEVPIDDD